MSSVKLIEFSPSVCDYEENVMLKLVHQSFENMLKLKAYVLAHIVYWWKIEAHYT